MDIYNRLEKLRKSTKSLIILNSVRQHNYFITQGNNIGLFLSFESQDAMHILGSHRVYIHEIHKIKSFISKSVTSKLHVTPFETNDLILCIPWM